MVDFSTYQVPDVYIQEEVSPLVPATGVNPSVVALIGQASGYQSATEQISLSGTSAVTLSRLGVVPSSVVVNQVDGSVVTGPQTLDNNGNLISPGSYSITVVAGPNGILDVANNSLTIQRVVQASPTLGNATTSATGSTLPSGTYYYKATATDAFGETVGSNEVQQTVAQLAAPVLNALTTAATGGTLGAGSFFYQVTAVNGQGETIGSNEQAITLSPLSAPVQNAMTSATTGGTFGAGTWFYKVCATNTQGSTIASNEQSISVTALTSPTLNGIAPSTAGGTLAAATYYYVVTATNALGETLASNEQTVTNTGSTSSNALNWTAVSGATGYKIYRGTTAGSENALVATIGSGITTVFSDTGAATSAASKPGSNTTITVTNAFTTTWSVVAGATGYKVYRGTSAGNENLLVGTIGSGVTVTFTDTNVTGTSATPPVTNTTVSTTNTVTVPWTAVSGATNYRIYRGVISGGENALLATVGAVASYTDTGTAGSVLSVPTVNTTARSIVLTITGTSVNATGYKIYRGTTAGGENVQVANLTGSTLTYTDSGSVLASAAPPAADTSSVISSGATVYVTYNYTTDGYDSPQTFTDYDSLKSYYGQPLDLETGAVLSPLSLAAQVAFSNGANTVIGVAVLGQFSRTALAAAYTKIFTNYNANLIVPVTDGLTAGDAQGIMADLRSHCFQASAQGYRRIGLVGFDPTVTTAPDTLATATADQRIVEMYPNAFSFYVGGDANVTLTIGGQYLAAAAAGILATNSVQTGLTRQLVRGLNGIPDTVNAALTRALRDQYSAAGVTVAERSRTGTIVIRQGTTTDVSSANTREISVVRAKDALIDLVHDGVENANLIGSPITEDTPLNVKGIVAGLLETAKTTGVIVDYENLLVRQQSSAPTVIEVKFGYQPSYPLNFIVLTFSIDVVTGSTTSTDSSTTDDTSTTSSS